VIERLSRSRASRPAPRAGVGHGATEAPRGILHRRRDGRGGTCAHSHRPPTSQNQARIEDDLRAFAPGILALSQDEARRRCEAAIRDYDPCISCSTHFLTLTRVLLPARRDPSCGSA
jgi:coenzyme F420-reducing hydrogenase alpha subunit